METSIKIATLFGGGARVTDTQEYLDTVEIGKLLVKHGYQVRCGGYYGLMEAVSKGVHEAGGIVRGITCKTFASAKGNSYLTETIPAEHIYERLNLLIERSNVFVIQRGGIGTLSELFLAMDIARKKKKDKPKIILVGSFWHFVMAELYKLMNEHEKEIVTIIHDYRELEEHIAPQTPVEQP